MNSRSVLNHSQQVGGPSGQAIGMGSERGGGRSGGMGSPSRSSPSIIGMPKQQQSRQPFTINRYHVLSSIAPSSLKVESPSSTFDLCVKSSVLSSIFNLSLI